jgi:hypothetical protein
MNVKTGILDLHKTIGMVWNKLIKKNIYTYIQFPEYEYGEDQYIITQILFFSKKIAYVNKPLYHYRYNKYSITNNYQKEQEKYISLYNNYNYIFLFLKEQFGGNISIFEPELTQKIELIKRMNPKTFINTIKRILRILIPVKIWRMLKILRYRIEIYAYNK